MCTMNTVDKQSRILGGGDPMWLGRRELPVKENGHHRLPRHREGMQMKHFMKGVQRI